MVFGSGAGGGWLIAGYSGMDDVGQECRRIERPRCLISAWLSGVSGCGKSGIKYRRHCQAAVTLH